MSVRLVFIREDDFNRIRDLMAQAYANLLEHKAEYHWVTDEGLLDELKTELGPTSVPKPRGRYR